MTLSSPRILVADDDPMLVDLYATWLSDDYDVVRAECGAEALAHGEDVDVAFLDRHMPRVSGDEAFEELLSRPSPPRIAFVSAATPDADTLPTGLDAYLTKPVTREDLRCAARALLTRACLDEEVGRFFALLSCRSAILRDVSAQSSQASEAFHELECELGRLADRVEDEVRALDDETVRRALPRGVTLDFDVRPPTGVP